MSMSDRSQPLASRNRAISGMDAQRSAELDRKSTRLNSSHTVISYAVFCLKKKKKVRVMAAPALAETPYYDLVAGKNVRGTINHWGGVVASNWLLVARTQWPCLFKRQ